MATIAQLKAQRDAIAAQAPIPPTSDSRFAEQQYKIKAAEHSQKLAVANAALTLAQNSAKPLSSRTNAQIESEFGKLIGLGAAATVDGGRITTQRAKLNNAVFQAAGGDTRLRALTIEMKKRGLYDAWMQAHQSASLWVSVFRPLLITAAVGAAAVYGAGLLSGAGTATGSAATITTSGAEGISLLGANTGLSTGFVTADAALTSAATGAVTSAATGGSAKDGALSGAVSGAAGTVKIEGVNMNTSAGTSINNFLTDLGQINQTVQSLKPKPAQPAQPTQTPEATIPAQIGGINTGIIVALLVIGIIFAKVI